MQYDSMLKGTGRESELPLRHIPEVSPANDTYAGPEGRRGDQVGFRQHLWGWMKSARLSGSPYEPIRSF